MKNIAYKTMKNNPNVPDGFIIDHYETDEDQVEGYTVVSKEAFNQLIANNVTLMRMHEANKGTVAADPGQPPHPIKPNDHAEVAEINIVTERQKAIQQAQDQQQQTRADAALFKEFLAWKRTQSDGS